MAAKKHKPSERLNRRQELAIAALLAGGTIEGAADKIGVSYATMKAWLRDARFQREYKDARRQVLERTIDKSLSLFTEALDALQRNLNSDKSASQIRAAVAILNHGSKGVETLDLIEEVKNLQTRLEELVSRGSGNKPKK